MTIELTRELLERYGRIVFPDSNMIAYVDRELARGADLMTAVENTLPTGHVWRLALCAGAEMARAMIAECQVPPVEEKYVPGGELIKNRLLRAAGIDPAAWEAAK